MWLSRKPCSDCGIARGFCRFYCVTNYIADARQNKLECSIDLQAVPENNLNSNYFADARQNKLKCAIDLQSVPENNVN